LPRSGSRVPRDAEMAAQLVRRAGEFGITSYAAREQAVPGLENGLALINRK